MVGKSKYTPEERIARMRARKSAYMLRWRREHPEEAKKRDATYYVKNRQLVLEKNRAYHHANKEAGAARSKRYRVKNSDALVAKQTQWRKDHPAEAKAIQATYRKNRAGKVSESRKQFHRLHPGAGGLFNKNYRERHKSEVEFAVLAKLRTRLLCAVKAAATKKIRSTCDLIGCSIPDLIRHIEALFTENMTWSSVLSGEVHIDHIIPCSAFDLAEPDEQERAFHFTNLQPLWATDNFRKNDILPASVAMFPGERGRHRRQQRRLAGAQA